MKYQFKVQDGANGWKMLITSYGTTAQVFRPEDSELAQQICDERNARLACICSRELRAAA